MKNAKFIIASGPVIIEDGKVLLNRHGETKKEQENWKFPGGKIENFDFNDELNSLEEACMREVREEMGIGVKIIMPLKPIMIKHPLKSDTVVILIHYLAKRIGNIKPADDIVEWNYFDISNLPQNCSPNIKPVTENYIELKEKEIIKA